jgi:hypothetical protein
MSRTQGVTKWITVSLPRKVWDNQKVISEQVWTGD